LDELVADSSLEILRVNNHLIVDRILNRIHEHETLDDLDVNEVFSRCLDSFKVPVTERPEITRSYSEIINALHEDDVNAG
jgi:exonuclease SbcD